MLDHVGIPVEDYQRAKAFYLQALRPLGYDLIVEVTPDNGASGSQAGFGAKARAQFWIGTGKPIKGRVHFAFEARSREAVRAFYNAAIKAGASDNGAPGLRPHYHENYYSAFVLDPDGHNIEAVCRLAE
jgi:catechol 2,3-dioxygenase-like lactoylglutathione lyase family enzyme